MSVKKRRYPVSAGLVVVHRYFLVSDTKGTVQTAWTEQEQTAFFDAFALFGKDWKKVSERIGTKSSVQVCRPHRLIMLPFSALLPVPLFLLSDYKNDW